MHRLTFEFDLGKSESNKQKHGIDFIEAQALWRSKIVLLAAKDATEKRYLVIGTIRMQYWSAIRIISVRKSTPLEIERYEQITG